MSTQKKKSFFVTLIAKLWTPVLRKWTAGLADATFQRGRTDPSAVQFPREALLAQTMLTTKPAQVFPQVINHADITYQTCGASHEEDDHVYDLLIITVLVFRTSFNHFIEFCNQALNQAALRS